MTHQPNPSNADPQIARRNTLLTARIIHATLLFGLLFFTAVAFFIAPGLQEEEGEAPAATQTAADPADDDGPELEVFLGIPVGVVLIGGIAFAALSPQFFAKQARTNLQNARTPQEADAAILQTWMSSVIVRSATLEGPGLFAAVSLMVTAQPLFLLPVAVAAAALIFIAPTQPKLHAFESAVRGETHASISTA